MINLNGTEKNRCEGMDVFMLKRLLVLNGPNLNLERDRSIYGEYSLEKLEKALQSFVAKTDFSLDCFQSNHEGELIDRLHEADGYYTGIIFNPAAYTHTSIALRDAIAAIDTPVIEVHLSNINKREEFRRKSLLAPVCHGHITGLGMQSYLAAAYVFTNHL